MRAGALDFDDRHGVPKSRFFSDAGEEWRDGRGRGLADRTAVVAHQKCDDRVAVMVVSASEVGIAALYPVDQPLLHQEFERAINRNRGWSPLAAGKHIHNLVRADRLMARRQRLQDSPARRGEPLPTLSAHGFRVGYGVAEIGVTERG